MHRIRSWARQHASEDTSGITPQRPALPTTSDSYREKGDKSANKTHNAGNTELPGPTVSLGNNAIININTDGPHDINTHNDANTTSASSPATALPIKSEAAGETNSTINNAPGQSDGAKSPTPITTRMKNGSKRFGQHTWDALAHSWVNVLLICVPAGIAVKAAGVNASVVFALNAVAIIPLAGMLAYATESVASRLGDTLGALLNVSFGNAVELIIFIIALVKNEIRIVQASLLGSILSNLLLILGMAFLLGGLRFQEQIYNNTVTQMSACLLSLAVTSLVLPTVFHASFSDTADADKNVLKISRGTSVVLLIVYVLYLAFQLKSHAYLYESTPQKIIDEESHPGILADLLDSSSSSSDSDTDSTNSSDTSGSHTTTKRIKRAFRNRRRRKSSVSSTNTVSLPSVISSPSVERPGSNWESQTVSTAEPSRQNSHQNPHQNPYLGAIASGDEADTDGDDAPRGVPRVRDFVQHLHTIPPPAEESNRKKKHKKRHHRHSCRWDEKHDIVDEDSSIRKMGKKPSHDMSPTAKVGFSDHVQTAADPSYQARRPFGLTFTRPSLRPALPKVLSQNVFISASGSPVIGAGTAPTTTSGLRRTSSLPDRLNRQGNAPVARGQVSDNIPPYSVRSIAPDADSTADHDDDEKPLMSRTSACIMLLISTGLVALCAEFMVDAIPEMLENSSVSQAFIGLIILPIVSNAAEHVTAVTVAAKNKMDLAIGVSVGSSIQIALFVTPLVVILGWILDKDMSLYFNLFETVSLFITTFLVNFLVLDGRSNYLEGSLLIAVYVIIAVSAFFYPDGSAQSSLGGGGSS